MNGAGATQPRGRRRPPALTPTGRSVTVASTVVLAAGWALGHRELITIAVAGLLAVMAGVAGVAVRPRATVSRTLSAERVMRGEAVNAELTVSFRPFPLPLPPLVVVDRISGNDVETTVPRPARAARTARRTYGLPTDRRGVVEVGPAGVVRTDALGLMRSEVTFGDTTEVLVYPRVYDLAPLSSGRNRDLEGPTHDGASGSITFRSLREYVTGDDLRLVHWRSSARTGTLMVREQIDPSQPYSTVVLDTEPGSYPDPAAFEDAVDAAASVLLASTSRRFPVKLFTGAGLVLQGQPSRATGDAALDLLTQLELAEGRLGTLRPAITRDPGGTSLVVITGSAAAAEEAMGLIQVVRNRYATLALVRFDPARVDGGAAWDLSVLDLQAPDAEAFATLWGQAA